MFGCLDAVQNSVLGVQNRVASRFPQVLRVIEWIRQNYAKPLHSATLASLASMAVYLLRGNGRH